MRLDQRAPISIPIPHSLFPVSYSLFLLHQRYPEPEHRPLRRRTRNFNRSAVGSEDGTRNRQAHTGAFPFARALLAAVKLLEDQWQIHRIDAGTVVLHAKLKPVSGAAAAQRDAAAGWTIARCILE